MLQQTGQRRKKTEADTASVWFNISNDKGTNNKVTKVRERTVGETEKRIGRRSTIAAI